MYTFVLIHGGWHDGDSWQEVAKELREKGHTVHTPTTAGHGPNVDRNVNHAQSTQSIVDYIIEHNLNNIILLGHSYAGSIISKVAEDISDRIQRLIYWNAFVLNDGESMVEYLPNDYGKMFSVLAQVSNHQSIMLPLDVWKATFINDADEEMAERTYKKLNPEPYQPFLDQLDLKKFYTLDIPKSFLNCLDDLTMPTGFWHPQTSSRLGTFKLVEMSGSHEVIFTNPVLLAEKIIEASKE